MDNVDTIAADPMELELVPEKGGKTKWFVLAAIVAVLVIIGLRRSRADRSDPVGADAGDTRA